MREELSLTCAATAAARQRSASCSRAIIDKEAQISITQTRKGEYQYKAKPQKNPYRGPVVILLDEESASESEEVAAGLQALGRVVVIGRTSRGEDMDATLQGL